MKEETLYDVFKKSLRESLKFTVAGLYTDMIVAILTGQKFTEIWWISGVLFLIGLLAITVIVFLVNLGEFRDKKKSSKKR